MTTYVAAMLLGLGPGAVYAALGLGLVLTYRSSGVINIAHGAFAMFATYQYAELREVGDLVLPVVGLPPRIHLTDTPTFGLALSVSLVMAALLSLVAYLVVFRPLRRAQPMMTVVAAVGLTIALQSVAVIQFGSDNRFLQPVLPQKAVHVFGATVSSDRLLLAGIVIVAAAALWAMSRWTTFGLASRAVADDEETTALIGRRPGWIAAANWMLAAVLAALAGILVAPISALNPTSYSLFVVPALAAALLGGLSSFGLTVLGALGIGVAQAVLLPVQQDVSWLNQPGLRALLPMILVLAVAGRRGALIPGRTASAVVTAPLPVVVPARRPLVGLLIGVPIGVVALFALTGAYRLGLERSLAGAVVCLSFVVLTGYVGQLSLAQMTIAGVAGFLLARLEGELGVPFPVAPLIAIAAAAGAGLFLGMVARRLRGLDLAVITLVGGVAIQEAVFGNPLVTGGLKGSSVPSPKIFGLDLGLAGPGFPRVQYGLLSLVLFAACGYGVARLRTAGLGRRMLAVRANERAAAAAGIDVRRTRVLAFTLSAAIAGLGGCLIGYGQGRLSFDSFGVTASLFFLAIAAVGGVTSVGGALVAGLLVPGGLAFTLLDRVAGLGEYQQVLCGLAVVVLAVLRPAGLVHRSAGGPGAARRLPFGPPRGPDSHRSPQGPGAADADGGGGDGGDRGDEGSPGETGGPPPVQGAQPRLAPSAVNPGGVS
ncbi:High-affinity branched-chain amino acid transport system permease protein braE [Frankia canadensis]|uniref:High-affinity branched-chain amino acid transport system permease protein braE n=1 Tax=Frankia canadensis TaxID=1836972 RepID=A0A2I2KLN4_9ACTN|nr:ABC transporter permease [Frankia canadensis]SNQ46556.1 High-affinity branched-chain amino acid transport system permease protein braE [Frankia canadensis]SOU53846.1 High-affinity branched-chain amino acid transport system permease protein braE [Frankia canadensis]